MDRESPLDTARFGRKNKKRTEKVEEIFETLRGWDRCETDGEAPQGVTTLLWCWRMLSR